ncbi:MAG TPA: ribokinase [Thermoanaerobaculia bacterium]|nr:ribokinase [Thermoanaerobaculia bacterium]
MTASALSVMGSFVADLAFRTLQLPEWGQTVLGSEFRLGPGGKGSNQAVAAARLGATVGFITKLGRDPFGDLARATYEREGIDARYCFETTEHATGGAAIIVHATKGENAIVVVPGSGFQLTTGDVDRAAGAIREAAIFMTQLEVPLPIVEHGLALARRAGVRTILNPAPASQMPDRVYPLCDFLTPNESEAAGLIGAPVADLRDAEHAADVFLSRGVQNVVITLGAQGALVKNRDVTRHVPAIDAGPVVETTGAGDAFNGGFAVALTEGLDLVEAARFGCAVAGISVTRHGTAPAMPHRHEVDALLRGRS